MLLPNREEVVHLVSTKGVFPTAFRESIFVINQQILLISALSHLDDIVG